MHQIFKTWLLCFAVMLTSPDKAKASWRDFATDSLERVTAWLELGETAVTEKLATPEEFSAVMPELVRKRGVRGIFGREVRNLGDSPEVFTLQASYLNSPDSNRPLVLWIDKIEGSKMTRYADLDSDGILDGVTFDGMPVLSNATMKALLTGDREMADAIFREMKEQAARYQPMYQADYSKVMRLALARYPQE
jgi:hypothetical protein